MIIWRSSAGSCSTIERARADSSCCSDRKKSGLAGLVRSEQALLFHQLAQPFDCASMESRGPGFVDAQIPAHVRDRPILEVDLDDHLAIIGRKLFHDRASESG